MDKLLIISSFVFGITLVYLGKRGLKQKKVRSLVARGGELGLPYLFTGKFAIFWSYAYILLGIFLLLFFCASVLHGLKLF